MTGNQNSEGWRPENLWRRNETEKETATAGDAGEGMGHWRGGPTQPRSKERHQDDKKAPTDYGVHWFGQRMSYEKWIGQEEQRPMRKAAKTIKASVKTAVSNAKEKGRELKSRIEHIRDDLAEKHAGSGGPGASGD